jgi:hypothetical protein
MRHAALHTLWFIEDLSDLQRLVLSVVSLTQGRRDLRLVEHVNQGKSANHATSVFEGVAYCLQLRYEVPGYRLTVYGTD